MMMTLGGFETVSEDFRAKPIKGKMMVVSSIHPLMFFQRGIDEDIKAIWFIVFFVFTSALFYQRNSIYFNSQIQIIGIPLKIN